MQINYEDSLEAKSYRDYKGNRTCKKYRDIGEGLELTKETGIAYQRKVAHAEIIKGVADGTFKLDEVEDLISRRENMDYDAETNSYTCRNGRQLLAVSKKKEKTASG